MEHDLHGRVALVTGSARRVGRAIALGFAQAGAHVVIHHSSSDADAADAATAARAHGVDALVVRADLATHNNVHALFEALTAHFGRLDVLVNSASIFPSGDLLTIAPEEWDAALNINLRAPFWCTQMAARMMRARALPGCIINIADNSGLRGWTSRPHHSVSKAGLLALTEVSAKALAADQIRVNALVLGPVLPEPDRTAESVQQKAAKLPLGRWGTPEDAARAAVFLARNDFITGAVWHVDGGESLG
jgi:NAD(P)-dependent dehydrogenase (short-subunit alcohol dehydrogenase family)